MKDICKRKKIVMNIVVLDTETAGLVPPEPGAGVCDIAIASVDEDFQVHWKVESLIDPECTISPEAMGVHHITPEMVWAQPTLGEFMGHHRYPLENVDVIIGHKVDFDLRFLKPYLPDRYQVIDTLKLSRILWPEADSHKLQTLRYTFGLDAGSAHRAIGDVITTISLARRIAEEVGTDARGLLQLMNAPLPQTTRIKFGKHRGEMLKDLPMTYVKWLVDKADIEPDLREALAARL